MLRYDPDCRITPHDILEHRFFKSCGDETCLGNTDQQHQATQLFSGPSIVNSKQSNSVLKRRHTLEMSHPNASSNNSNRKMSIDSNLSYRDTCIGIPVNSISVDTHNIRCPTNQKGVALSHDYTLTNQTSDQTENTSEQCRRRSTRNSLRSESNKISSERGSPMHVGVCVKQ